MYRSLCNVEHATFSTIFDKLSHTWWDPNGPFRLLHEMNPLRIEYITQHVMSTFNIKSKYPLNDLRILDIGCGGGLLSFPLASLGAKVLGIDLSSNNIDYASKRSQLFPFSTLSLEFRHTSVQNLLQNVKEKKILPFNIIVAMEMIEHLESESHQRQMILDLLQLLEPGGLLFLSTMNKSCLSTLLTINIAEDLLSLVPKGTHDPNLYVAPEQIQNWINDSNKNDLHQTKVQSVQGIFYHPLNRTWIYIPWTGIHYMMAINR